MLVCATVNLYVHVCYFQLLVKVKAEQNYRDQLSAGYAKLDLLHQQPLIMNTPLGCMLCVHECNDCKCRYYIGTNLYINVNSLFLC